MQGFVRDDLKVGDIPSGLLGDADTGIDRIGRRVNPTSTIVTPNLPTQLTGYV